MINVDGSHHTVPFSAAEIVTSRLIWMLRAGWQPVPTFTCCSAPGWDQLEQFNSTDLTNFMICWHSSSDVYGLSRKGHSTDTEKVRMTSASGTLNGRPY